MNPPDKKRVLFLCTANSARSLMAEALLRHHAGHSFEVHSAGLKPLSPDPAALRALDGAGIDRRGLSSKPMSDFLGQPFDFVITLCDKATRECGHFPGADEMIAWNFEDPATRAGFKPYETTLNELGERIRMFALVQRRGRDRSPEPAAFFKYLADDTRLRTLLLLHAEGELCVCELTEALALSQPKVSRHLAQLRQAGLLADRRRGQWVFYRLSADLPPWMRSVLDTTAANNTDLTGADTERLMAMGERPQRTERFC